MLFYTGTDRLSSEHARAIVENMDAKGDRLRRMHEMVFQAADIMAHGDLDEIGAMLDETWRLKRGLARNVTSDAVDEIYDTAIRAGALGGKLLGAGGAGFMLFHVPDDKRAAVRLALRRLIQVSVRIDDAGSIILYKGENGISGFAAPGTERVKADRIGWTAIDAA
jgi:D-glycero-alpha-D-manno-heptose-7-phosphate kinase